MAKAATNVKVYRKKVKRRTKPPGLRHRKKLGPKSSFRTAAALAAFLLPASSTAQVCVQGDYSRVLKENHGEVPFVRGISESGALMIVFVNEKTGAWTLSFIPPHAPDTSCVGATGSAFEIVKKEEGKTL